MSVDVRYFIVDWHAFRSDLAASESAFDVFEEREMEPEEMSIDSMKAQMRFLERYDEFKGDWRASSKPAFEAFFNALFWSWRDDEGEQIVEMPEAEGDMIDSAWSPATVKRFARLWSEIDLSGAQPAYERGAASELSFEGFCSYAEEHGVLVRRAAEEDKGLIVYIC